MITGPTTTGPTATGPTATGRMLTPSTTGPTATGPTAIGRMPTPSATQVPPGVRRVLVARLDSMGDVLLCGAAVRAVAAGAEVVLLTGPQGRAAGQLLPGVSQLLEFDAPWVTLSPQALRREPVEALVAEVAQMQVDAALILTSFHQSPLPLALLLRLAAVPWIGATSIDYPGLLLDLRHPRDETMHEAEQQLSLAVAAGFPADPAGAALAVRRPLGDTTALTGPDPYVVLHPGAAQPARRPSVAQSAALAHALGGAGYRIVVTGAETEGALTGPVAAAAGRAAIDLTGRLELPELADVLARADVAVVPNTGPAHLAAAVGTPVVSLFAPVVPASRWGPYGVPTVVLGQQDAACRDSRARTCPVPGHPCLDRISPQQVVAAVARLARAVSPAPDRHRCAPHHRGEQRPAAVAPSPLEAGCR